MRQHIPQIINLPEGLEVLFHAQKHTSVCPTCKQQTLLRRETIHKEAVRVLWFMRDRPNGTVKPKEVHENFGRTAYANYAKLKYWELIEDLHGSWKITNVGAEFLRGECMVPEILWVYNDVPRLVPTDMYGRWVSVDDLMPYKEMSREIAAKESLQIDATGQEDIGI